MLLRPPKVAGDEAELSSDPVAEVVYEATGVEPKLRDPMAAEKAQGPHRRAGWPRQREEGRGGSRDQAPRRRQGPDRHHEAALKAAGIAGMVSVGDRTWHLIARPNADQYAAEMRGQLASTPEPVLN